MNMCTLWGKLFQCIFFQSLGFSGSWVLRDPSTQSPQIYIVRAECPFDERDFVLKFMNDQSRIFINWKGKGVKYNLKQRINYNGMIRLKERINYNLKQ